MTKVVRSFALALLLVAAGCSDPATPADAADRPPGSPAEGGLPTGGPAPGVEAPAERPETIEETVVVEGADETVTLRLVTFADAPLPFSTYVYEDWASDVVSSGEGTAVRLTTGTPPYEGTLSLFVPPGSPSLEGVAAIARAVAESYGDVQEMASLRPWVRSGFSFRDGATIGTVQVGEHGGTAFYVLEAFQEEMGDGFGPASAVALDRLRWLDDGTGL